MLSKSSNKSRHAFTPSRQRALVRRSYGLIALAVVVVLLALAQFGEDGLATLLRLQSRENELVDDVRMLEAQNEELSDKLDGLANDPAVLEALAREQHNMQKPQEEVLTVIPEPSSQDSQAE